MIKNNADPVQHAQTMAESARRTIVKAIVVVVIIFGLIQIVPFGHTHANPPVTAEPAWNSPRTQALFQRACFDCHSNQTRWPWYSHVAPISWLVERDVEDGRRHLNFTQWDQAQRHANDVAREIASGDMPLWFYLPMHPAARLSPAEKQALIDGAAASLGPQAPPRPNR